MQGVSSPSAKRICLPRDNVRHGQAKMATGRFSGYKTKDEGDVGGGGGCRVVSRRPGDTTTHLSVAERSYYALGHFKSRLPIYVTTSRDNSVGVATDYRMDGRVRFPARQGIFLFPTAPRPTVGPTQPSTPGYWGCFSGGKQAGTCIWPLTPT
jgi:hypothetical protein